MTKSDRGGERVNTGIAFVRFRDAEEAAVAAAAQHRKMMGNRYIECIPYTAPTVRINAGLDPLRICRAVPSHNCSQRHMAPLPTEPQATACLTSHMQHQQGPRGMRPPLMGGPPLYPAPMAMQLPSPLPYGLPVGPQPPFPPRVRHPLLLCIAML